MTAATVSIGHRHEDARRCRVAARPSERSPCASRSVSSRSSAIGDPADVAVLGLPDDGHRLGGPIAPRRSTHWCARLVFPPVNQVAHSTPRDVSRTCSYGVRNEIPRSRTTASQNHAMSPTDRATSSSYVSIPWARMNRVTFARSMYSGDGDHTTSCTPTRYNRVDGAASRGGRDRLVRLLPHHAGGLVQGADVRGRPGRLRGRRHRTPPRDRLVRLRVRGLRGGHQHLRRVRPGPARRGPAAGPDRGVGRPVRDRDRRDADPVAASRGPSRSRRIRRRPTWSRTAGSSASRSIRCSTARWASRRSPWPGWRCAATSTRAAGPPRSAPTVARRNRAHAATNPRAAYADVADPTPLFDPLTSEQAAKSTDGCVVTVLAAEDRGRHAAVWVDGVGWSQDAPSLESRSWGEAVAARRAGEMAYRQAEVEPDDVDLAEVDDTFAYKQLQHLDALGLARARSVAREPVAAARSARATCTRRTASRGSSAASSSCARARAASASCSRGAASRARRRRPPSCGGPARWWAARTSSTSS